jgi:hypothetical protein
VPHRSFSFSFCRRFLFLFCFLLRCRWYRITLFCIQLTKRKKTYGNLYFKSTHKRNRNFYFILFYFLKNKINFQKLSWKNWKAFSVYCLSESHHSVISQEVIAVNWQGKAGHTHTHTAGVSVWRRAMESKRGVDSFPLWRDCVRTSAKRNKLKRVISPLFSSIHIHPLVFCDGSFSTTTTTATTKKKITKRK